MALSARTLAQEGYSSPRTKQPGGEMMLQKAGIVIGATGDYGANGILLSAIAPLVGMRKIHNVLALSLRSSAGALKVYQFLVDPTNGTIRLYKGAAVEITAGSDLAAGDIMQLALVGV